MYFNLTYPVAVAMLAMLTGLLLPKLHPTFRNFTETFKLLSTTGLYLFSAHGIAELFMVFPCYVAEEGNSRMV